MLSLGVPNTRHREDKNATIVGMTHSAIGESDYSEGSMRRSVGGFIISGYFLPGAFLELFWSVFAGALWPRTIALTGEWEQECGTRGDGLGAKRGGDGSTSAWASS